MCYIKFKFLYKILKKQHVVDPLIFSLCSCMLYFFLCEVPGTWCCLI